MYAQIPDKCGIWAHFRSPRLLVLLRAALILVAFGRIASVVIAIAAATVVFVALCLTFAHITFVFRATGIASITTANIVNGSRLACGV